MPPQHIATPRPIPPSRAPRAGPAGAAAAAPAPVGTSRAVSLAAAAALGAAPFVGRVGIAAAIAALVAAAVARHRRADVTARNAALASSLALATLALPPGSWAWPAPLVLALAAAVRPAWRGPDGLVPWLRAGTARPSDVAWALGIAAASAIALVAWTLVRYPDVAEMKAALPEIEPVLLVAGGIGWAILNAAGEEAIFRGALLDALDRAVGARSAVVVQALAFGLLHWRGFPRGPDGVVLATIYGLMLGAVCRRTGGLLAPVLAHVFADVVIFCLLVAAA